MFSLRTQSVLGGDPRSNLYTIDGAYANDTTVGYILTDLPVDMVEEIQVTTSGATAEFGNSSGGVFNFVTKSGGNEFSGGGYYFYQGEGTEWSNITPELEAELGAKTSKLKDSDVGGTFGDRSRKMLSGSSAMPVTWTVVSYHPSSPPSRTTPLRNRASSRSPVR